MLTTKCWFIWPSGFRGEDILEIDQSETRIACDRHVCKWIGTKSAFMIEDLPQMHPTKFRFIWPSGFRGEFFLKNQPIRNKNCLWRPCLLSNRDEMSILYRGHSKNVSYHMVVHFWNEVAEDNIFQKSTNQKQELPVMAIFVNGSGRNEQSLQRTFQ